MGGRLTPEPGDTVRWRNKAHGPWSVGILVRTTARGNGYVNINKRERRIPVADLHVVMDGRTQRRRSGD